MTSIQAALKLLGAIKPTKKEVCKVKILLAAHGEWVTSRQIRTNAKFKGWQCLSLVKLMNEGYLEQRRMMHIVNSGKKCLCMFYRCTPKGTKYVTKLMK
jgi:hypothetical protein